jgi:hypothetical protein
VSSQSTGPSQQPSVTVGMVLFPNLTQLDLTGPYEVFARMPNTSVLLAAATMMPAANTGRAPTCSLDCD